MRLVPPPLLRLSVDVDPATGDRVTGDRATGNRATGDAPAGDPQPGPATQPESDGAARAVDVARSTPWWLILLGIATTLYRS